MDELEDEETEAPAEAEPEIVLTPEEKIANLKASLKAGELGPTNFCIQWQDTWLPMVDARNGTPGALTSSRSRGSVDHTGARTFDLE